VKTFNPLQRIAAGESQTQEFKASFDKACVVSLVAFANTRGGTVWVGVTDKGALQGVSLGKETLNEWLGQIKSSTSPSLIPELTAHPIEGKTIVAIEVAEFPVKPVSTRGRYYKRIASANHALALNEISDLYLQTLQISWDAHPAPGRSVEELSPSKVESFIQQVNAGGRFALEAGTPLAALQKLNYVTSAGQPTWAALLLFASEPLRHHVHIGRFKTPSMILDDRQLTDTLFEVVEKSMAFIVSHISVAFEFDGAKNALLTLCPRCARHCSTPWCTAAIQTRATSRSKFLTTASPSLAQVAFTVVSAWRTSRPTTTAPACATSLWPKAFT
jgi:ATP-dependent DNA helicase RecG